MSQSAWSFDWSESERQLLDLATTWALRPDGRGGFEADGIRFVPPLVLPPVGESETPELWTRRVPSTLGVEIVVLLRAGAAALGVWRDDRLVGHVARKRYVVRGQGRAQPTHLRTRGKSRYGSRLRLQNHRRLLDEVVERLRGFVVDEGEPDVIHHAAPSRLWDELLACDPAPPFARDDERLRRIPLHVHVPDHRELLRVRRAMTRGRVERA